MKTTKQTNNLLTLAAALLLAAPSLQAEDTTAPIPNPMTFAIAPGPAGADSVTMTATTATDALSPPVQYFFENTINSANSGWISGTAWTDTGLTAGTVYGYRVKARDAVGNETGWSGVASAVLPLPGQVPLDFEFVSAGSSSPPWGWSVVTVPGKSGSYTATASGQGSNGTGGSGGLGGQLTASTPVFSVNLPGVYLVNSGFPTGVDVRWAISGSYDLNMGTGSGYGSCAFLFGDIASGLPGTAGSLLEVANKISVFANDPEQIINGAGTPLFTNPNGGARCNVGTWYRVTFAWTPTIGTTGNFSYMVNAYSSGAWRADHGGSLTGYTFDNPQAYFGFGSMVAPNTIFDNINITGTAYGTPFDTDGDGMSDSYELANTDPPSATSMNPGDDSDSDGLTHLQEYQHGTLPNNPDTDGDTLNDGPELAGAGSRPATDPLKADTDGDSLRDNVETNTGTWASASDTGTNPTKADTDADGLKDGVETNTGTYVSTTNTGTNPLAADTDADGTGDWYEITASFTSPFLAAEKPDVPYPLPDPDSSTGNPLKKVKVYIMSGQSNMVGFGTRDGTEDKSLETMTLRQNKFPDLINSSGAWTTRQDVRYRGVISDTAKVQLSPGTLGSTFGPELGFGYVIGWHHDEPVLLLKSCIGNRALGWDILPPGSTTYQSDGYQFPAYGETPEKWTIGSPTTPWTPGAWYAGYEWDRFFMDESEWAHPHAAEINVVDVLDNFSTEYPDWATLGFEIAGFVWWQGDRDRYTMGHATRYEQNLVKLITSLRNYYTNRYPGKVVNDAPFVLATLGQTILGDNSNPAEKTILDGMLAVDGESGKYPQFAGNVKTVYAHPLSEGGASNGHYDGRAGTYMLVGDALGRAMVELEAGTTPTDFAAWQSANSATGQTLADDHDQDGVPNGIEWFLKGSNNSTGFTALPGVAKDPGTGALSVTWTKDAGYPGAYPADFVVETSETLTGTWDTEASPGTVTLTGNEVKYTFPTPLGSRKFARLKVTGP